MQNRRRYRFHDQPINIHHPHRAIDCTCAKAKPKPAEDATTRRRPPINTLLAEMNRRNREFWGDTMTTTTPIEQTELEELAQETAGLAQHRAAIDAIHARRAERQKAADIATLAKVRAELLERQTFYDEHLPIFRAQEQDYSNARAHIIVAREALAECSRGQPAVAVFLPEDPVVQRWSKRHAQLEQRLADAEAALRALPDPETIRLSLVYCGEVISRLTYSQTNLVRKLSGETATWMDGGVSNVGGGTPPGSGKSWIR